jgi:transcriptional regulator with XRE-family HTH domain
MARQGARHLPTIIGQNIRQARGERTQRDVAQAIGVPDVYISRWERGLHPPSDEHRQALANELFAGEISALYREQELAA